MTPPQGLAPAFLAARRAVGRAVLLPPRDSSQRRWTLRVRTQANGTDSDLLVTRAIDGPEAGKALLEAWGWTVRDDGWADTGSGGLEADVVLRFSGEVAESLAIVLQLAEQQATQADGRTRLDAAVVFGRAAVARVQAWADARDRTLDAGA